MATVKICPACQTENLVRSMFCQHCFVSLAQVQRTEARPMDDNNSADSPVIPIATEENTTTPTPDTQASEHPLTHQQAKEARVCPECGYEDNPPQESQCMRCDVSLPSSETSLAIHWPWGDTVISHDFLIGREPDHSTIADRLADYSNISRTHAEILAVEQHYYLRDLASTNGTFVNDQKIAPYEKILLCAGMRIRFASDLHATIQEGKKGNEQ